MWISGRMTFRKLQYSAPDRSFGFFIYSFTKRVPQRYGFQSGEIEETSCCATHGLAHHGPDHVRARAKNFTAMDGQRFWGAEEFILGYGAVRAKSVKQIFITAARHHASPSASVAQHDVSSILPD